METVCDFSVMLKIFTSEIVRLPITQSLILQAIFAATRSRSIMPLQFRQAIATITLLQNG